MTNPNGNLFDRSKAPSVAFKIVGQGHTMKITDWPSLKDSKNFETGQVERWQDGSPKKIILVPVSINSEAHALWVTPGTALFAAVEAAQNAAGAEIAPGGTLSVTYTHDVPSSKGAHFAPAKQYSATYAPPSAFTKAADPFAQAAGPVTPAASSTPPAPAPSAAAPAAGKQMISPEQFAALSAVPGMDMSPYAIAGA
jgi:hypothetical protein